jgi:hypothetical protein
MRPMENWRVSIYMNHVLVDEKVFQSEAPPDADIIRAMEALHTETGTYIITAYAVYSSVSSGTTSSPPSRRSTLNETNLDGHGVRPCRRSHRLERTVASVLSRPVQVRA